MTTPSPDAPAPHVPSPPPAAETPDQSFAARSPYARAAIWVAVGALVAAALICVVWVRRLGRPPRQNSPPAPAL